MGMVASICTEPIKRHRVERDLDGKVADALRERTRSRQRTFRSVNSITMRLPRFKEGLRDIKDIFDQYDEDSDGTIDSEELQSFASAVQVQMSEEEMNNLHRYCDIDSRNGVQFQEFVVLLCLMYLLFGPDVTRRVSEFESAKLNYVFDELIDAYIFFDKDGDGKLTRRDVAHRMNEASHQERTPGHITAQLFSTALAISCFCSALLSVSSCCCSSSMLAEEEMDLNRNGEVDLKEFLYSMIRWAGLGTEDDGSDEASP